MPAKFSTKLNNVSIRNKLILMQVFTSVLVLSIVFTVFVITDINGYKQRKVDSMISLAQVVGSNNISTLQFQDADAATEILTELHVVSPEIIQASILDNQGNLFATYSRPGDSLPPQPAFYNKKFVFSGYISKRLLRLVHTMKHVSKTGELDKLEPDDGKDEISTLNKAFNNLMLQIKESQERKDEFVGIVSHELKTPLTTVKGYMDLLSILEDSQPRRLYVQKAQSSLKKLENLIKDLLDVSKMRSGQLELNITGFDINILLDETITAMQMVSPSHQIIRKGVTGNLPIRADRQRIEQVLFNIISNAIKYSPGEKEVHVYSELTEKELIIHIKDFGKGVPEEEQTNIFERFYRGKDLSVHISGFGLGLYICRDIIKRHKGRIAVKSGGKGSVFYFSLPLNQAGTVN